MLPARFHSGVVLFFQTWSSQTFSSRATLNKGYGDQVGNSFTPALLLKATRCHLNLMLWRNTAVISLKPTASQGLKVDIFCWRWHYIKVHQRWVSCPNRCKQVKKYLALKIFKLLLHYLSCCSHSFIAVHFYFQEKNTGCMGRKLITSIHLQ